MSDNSYRRNPNRNISKNSPIVEEISEDLKNDLLVAFNLYKNEEGLISKLKLRTLLFSFAMYKSAPKDINDYIAEYFPKQEEFTFDNLLKLVFNKLKILREKEAEDLFVFLANGSDISKAYQANGIDISERELNEMVAFMTGNEKSEDIVISKDDLKKFYIS